MRTPRKAMPRFDLKHLGDDQLQLIHRDPALLAVGPAAKDSPALQR